MAHTQVFVVMPNMTWHIILSLNFLASHNCCIRVQDRTLWLERRPPSSPRVNLRHDVGTLCATISAAVTLMPNRIDPVLPADPNLNSNAKKDLRDLLAQFEDVFAWDDRSLG
ncbi:unnamed protein product [Schistocephalus solidus]|uniref:ULP_PROTEASE domain-containing protein n=1 Tax=Schistocephalus solidus TaxID=70667 RepID=A0A183T6W0_SCHSO|nr:unnamed protein product [Schistocephalus solidus]